MRRLVPRISLLARFSALSLAAMCATGLSVGLVLHERVERRAGDAATKLAIAATSTGARASLTSHDLTGRIGPDRLHELDRRLAAPLGQSGVAHATVYGPAGRVVYSSERTRIGTRDAGVPELLASGQAMSHGVTDPVSGQRMLSICVPVRVGSATQPNAVFEIHVPYAPIAAGIASDTRTLAGLLALGLAVLWLSIFGLVSNASRLLTRQAKQDHLTGLPNRAALHAAGARALLGSRQSGQIGALLLIDLDRFKEVNDTLGHDQGDRLLCEVATRLSEVLRPGDTLARLGGDEFAILVRDLPHRGATADIAARVTDALRRPFDLCGVAIELGASIGVAIHPDHGTDVTTLLRRADVAMYDAKRGQDGVRTYERDRDPYSPERLALVAELRTAIQRDELVLHYQPKVSIDRGTIAGVEALVRWQHGQRGLLAPVEFIPLAERMGVIGAVTDWVLDNALQQCRRWREDGLVIPVAVNLAGADVVDSRLPERVSRALQRADLPGAMLQCEISEDTVLADPHRAIESLRRLRTMGVRLSLDDFGRGQSSMSYLKRLPLDQIKIDRSFVIGMGSDNSDASIVRTTIDLGRNLGLEVVAEGVESGEALDQLTGLRCDIAQGFHLSRPLPAAEFEAWLTARAAHAPA